MHLEYCGGEGLIQEHRIGLGALKRRVRGLNSDIGDLCDERQGGLCATTGPAGDTAWLTATESSALIGGATASEAVTVLWI
ncbi:Uncharacterised protein [Mycobacteroides abscessus]|nr:Uncharacterised protein [Mycobacteroides abscessus]